MGCENKEYSDQELEALSKTELIDVAKQLRKTIDELRNQSRKNLLSLLPGIEGLEFLQTIVDLKEPVLEVPETENIPFEKRWSAVTYKKAYPNLTETERIKLYLEKNWKGYRITRGILQTKMQDLYKYAEAYKALNIIPTEEQLRMKATFQRLVDQATKE